MVLREKLELVLGAAEVVEEVGAEVVFAEVDAVAVAVAVLVPWPRRRRRRRGVGRRSSTHRQCQQRLGAAAVVGRRCSPPCQGRCNSDRDRGQHRMGPTPRPKGFQYVSFTSIVVMP